jgi:hypothetical protein
MIRSLQSIYKFFPFLLQSFFISTTQKVAEDLLFMLFLIIFLISVAQSTAKNVFSFPSEPDFIFTVQ